MSSKIRTTLWRRGTVQTNRNSLPAFPICPEGSIQPQLKSSAETVESLSPVTFVTLETLPDLVDEL